ncbi:hypothetical protein MMC07_009416 [Pseudocyphellaria aurata]|nr:hypothetical protein [Pseudocyphellaria aurata]
MPAHNTRSSLLGLPEAPLTKALLGPPRAEADKLPVQAMKPGLRLLLSRSSSSASDISSPTGCNNSTGLTPRKQQQQSHPPAQQQQTHRPEQQQQPQLPQQPQQSQRPQQQQQQSPSLY